MWKRILLAAPGLFLAAPATFAADAPSRGAAPGMQLKHADCGPCGHRGPWGGCTPGGQYGAGN